MFTSAAKRARLGEVHIREAASFYRSIGDRQRSRPPAIPSYLVQFDRSTAGEMTRDTDDSGGTVAYGPYSHNSHTLESALVGNAGDGIAGSNSTGRATPSPGSVDTDFVPEPRPSSHHPLS